MNELEKVWLACAIDSEGFIGWDKSGKNPKPRIAIANTNREFMEKAAALIGIKLCIQRTEKKDYKQRRTLYRAEYGKRDEILRILLEIQPYLIVKRERAEEMINWIKKHPPMSEEERLRRARVAMKKAGFNEEFRRKQSLRASKRLRNGKGRFV